LLLSVEEGFDDGTRMAVAAVEIDKREVLKLMDYLTDLMK